MLNWGARPAGSAGGSSASSRRIVLGESQDHVRPDLELQIDLAARSPVRAPAIRVLTVRSAAPLSAPAVEDHLDVAVVTKSLQEVFVEAAFVTRYEEQVSGHSAVYCLSALGMAGHFFLAAFGRGAFEMPVDQVLKFLHFPRRRRGPTGRFGRFFDEGNRCRE